MTGTPQDERVGASGPAADIDVIARRVARLEERQKEREVSLFAALKTLARDVDDYYRGNRPSPPTEAAWGVVFAYLRRRGLIFALGGVVGAGIAGLQLYLLAQQNEILTLQQASLDLQTASFTEQTKATQIAAVSELILVLADRDRLRASLAEAQLAAYGDFAFEPLMRILVWGDIRSIPSAYKVLMSQFSYHTVEQVVRVLEAWSGPLPDSAVQSGVEDPATPQLFLNAASYFGGIAVRAAADSSFRSSLLTRLVADSGGLRRDLAESISRSYRVFVTTAPAEGGGADWHHAFHRFCHALPTGELPESSSDVLDAYTKYRDSTLTASRYTPPGFAAPPVYPSVPLNEWCTRQVRPSAADDTRQIGLRSDSR